MKTKSDREFILGLINNIRMLLNLEKLNTIVPGIPLSITSNFISKSITYIDENTKLNNTTSYVYLNSIKVLTELDIDINKKKIFIDNYIDLSNKVISQNNKRVLNIDIDTNTKSKMTLIYLMDLHKNFKRIVTNFDKCKYPELIIK